MTLLFAFPRFMYELNANELWTKNAYRCTNAMNGDFRLIDYINDLFLGKPYRMLYEHLENGTSSMGSF